MTRTVTRDSKSSYYLNGSASSFSEVTALLRSKGIDLDHNRFLILQGEVELISQMKPKATAAGEEGLLEYLEDIIGSSKLVPRIKDAAASVDVLTEQRATGIRRLQAAEKERDALAQMAASGQMPPVTE